MRAPCFALQQKGCRFEAIIRKPNLRLLLHLGYFGIRTDYIRPFYLNETVWPMIRMHIPEVNGCLDAHVSSFRLFKGFSEGCPEGGMETWGSFLRPTTRSIQQRVEVIASTCIHIRGYGPDQGRLGAMSNQSHMIGKSLE